MNHDIVTENGVAIGGYDPVAYFLSNAALRGKPEFTHTWGGAEWHFTSEETRDLFAANPERFAPQFGGNCAFAVSLGQNAAGHPETWSIVDDKLYFNATGGVRTLWKLIPGRIAAGHRKWSAA